MVRRLKLHHSTARSSRAWFGMLAALFLPGLMIGYPMSAHAHGTPEEALSHTLTVLVSYPDAGLSPDETLCLELFLAEDVDLTAAIQRQCLAPGSASVTFTGLMHGQFQVAVPALDSALSDERYEGRVAETAIPDDPEVDAYIIEVPLALTGAFTGTTGAIVIGSFVCPAGTSNLGAAEVWSATCPNRVGGVTYTVQAELTLNGSTASASTDDQGMATFADLPADTYLVTEEPLANVSTSSAWFATSNLDGATEVFDPSVPLPVRPTETVVLTVFHVLAEDAAPLTVGSGDPAAGDPATVVPAPDNPTAAPSIASTEIPAVNPVVSAYEPRFDLGPFISTGGDVVSGIQSDDDKRHQSRPHITVLPSTGTLLSPHAGPSTISWVVSVLIGIVFVMGHSRSWRSRRPRARSSAG